MRLMTFLALAAISGAAQAAAPITGRWLTDDAKAIVTIRQCGKVVCGNITRILAPTPNGPPVDERNPDPKLRHRPIQGLEVLSGFTDQGKDWRGRIYDPEAGKWYKSIIVRETGGLNAKGWHPVLLPRAALDACAVTERPALQLAGTYRRHVHASLARIWENVFDWEHLAHLHDGSFAECALLDRGPWGWRVALTPIGGAAQELEMRADRPSGRYTSTTLAGTGAGTEIRVALTPLTAGEVDVLVEFHLPEVRPARLAALGEAFATAYARLWDEDEAMMQARELALTVRPTVDRTAASLDLGKEPVVRATLPLAFELGGAPFRLVDLDGELVAHSTICPHWLGPLDDAPVIDGTVRCPWHGYRFDVVSGACAVPPGLRLAPAPAIRIDAGRVVAAWR